MIDDPSFARLSTLLPSPIIINLGLPLLTYRASLLTHAYLY